MFVVNGKVSTILPHSILTVIVCVTPTKGSGFVRVAIIVIVTIVIM